MLAQIMPRTGGDYVFNSRSLHPSIGFAGNFSYCVWLAVIYGVYTTYLAAYGFGAFGRMMAGFTGRRLARLRRLVLEGLRACSSPARSRCCSRPRSSSSAGCGCSCACRSARSCFTPSARSCCRSSSGSSRARPASSRNFNDYAANLGTDNAAAALAKLGPRPAGFAHTGLRHRDDAQVGHAVLVHLRLPLLEQLLRRGDPPPQEHAFVSIPGALAVAAVGIALLLLAVQQRHRLRRSTGCSASPIPPRTGSRPARPPIRRSWASRPAPGCSRRS